MTTDQITSRRSADRPLKSPLAVPGRPGSGVAAAVDVIDVPTTREALSERAVTRAEFEDYLRTTNNRYGRPYEETSISAYVCPAKTLDEWMTANSIDSDYTAADTAMLNRFFREY